MEIISNMQRFLVLEFMSLGYDTSQVKQLSWSAELYAGESKHLSDCSLYCEETHGPVLPRSRDGKCDMFALTFDNQPTSDVLEVLYFRTVYALLYHFKFSSLIFHFVKLSIIAFYDIKMED